MKKESNSLRECTDDDHVINPEIEQSVDTSAANEHDKIFQTLVQKEIEKVEQKNRRPTDGDDMKLRQAKNEKTPDQPTKATNFRPSDPQGPERRKRNLSLRRELFPSTSSSQAQKWTKGKYTLRGIYKRFYHSHPDNSHEAESDVMTLMKCAIACKSEFIKIVNEDCVEFKDVKKF